MKNWTHCCSLCNLFYFSEEPMGKLELFTPKFKERIVSDRSGGERISRNNNLRDALYQTAGAAGLAPVREGRFLLPVTDAAMDVTIVTPP